MAIGTGHRGCDGGESRFSYKTSYKTSCKIACGIACMTSCGISHDLADLVRDLAQGRLPVPVNGSPRAAGAGQHAGVEYSGPPQGEVQVPAPIARCARGRAVAAVWVNIRGGVAFRIGGTGEDDAAELYAKWAPAGAGLDLAAEGERLAWASAYTRVPRPVARGEDADGAWLVTEALPGLSAVSERWRAEPERAVRAMGEGLRALHERLPVDDCPFTWSVAERGKEPDVPADLPEPPPHDRLVVCHGDACAPNTLLGGDGRWFAHVDFGDMGVADRWADLAVGSHNLGYNFGPGWEAVYFDAYGIAPDPERLAYYRALAGMAS